MDKVFIGREQIVIASYFYDSAGPIEFEDLEEALTSGHRAGELRTYARKREFNSSPSSYLHSHFDTSLVLVARVQFWVQNTELGCSN